MTDAQYETKFKEMQKYIPFLWKVIEELKVTNAKEEDNSRQTRLQKIERLHEFLTNKPKQLKMETLMKFEGILIKLNATYEKQQNRNRQNQEHRQHQHYNIPEQQQLSSDKQNHEENLKNLEDDKISGTGKKQELLSDSEHFKNVDDKRVGTGENFSPQDKNDYHHEESSKDHHNTTKELNSSRINSPLKRRQNLSEDSHTPNQSPQQTMTSSQPQNLNTVKIVTTEHIPVHTKQQHVTSYLQSPTQNCEPRKSICHSNLRTLPQLSNHHDKVETLRKGNNDYSPVELWEQFNDRPTCKSPITVLPRPDDKDSETASLSATNSMPIFTPGNSASLPDVPKTHPPLTNDINKPVLNLDEYKLSNNISKKGTEIPQSSVEFEKDNASKIVIIPIDVLKTLSPSAKDTNKPVLQLDVYNQQYNDRPSYKSPKTILSRLDDKVLETTSLSAINSAPIFMPGHCDYPPDILKTPSHSTNDMNIPELNLDKYELSNDISKIDSKMIQKSVEHEEDKASDILIIPREVMETPSHLTNDNNKPVLDLNEEYKLSNDVSKIFSRISLTSIKFEKENARDIIIISSDDKDTIREIDTNTNKKHNQVITDVEKSNHNDLSEKSSKKDIKTFCNEEIREMSTKNSKPQEYSEPTARGIVNPENKYQECIDSSTTIENPYENTSTPSCSSTFFTNFKKIPHDNDIPTTSSYTFSTTFKKEPEDFDLTSMVNISNNVTLNDIEQQIINPNADSHHILRLLRKFFNEDIEIENIWQTENQQNHGIKEEITKNQILIVKEEPKEDERNDDIISCSKTMKIQSQTFIPVTKMINSEVDINCTTISQSNETNNEKSLEHRNKTETTVKRMEAKIDSSKPLRITIKIYTTNDDDEKDKMKDDSLKSDTTESSDEFSSNPRKEETSLQRKIMEEKSHNFIKLAEESARNKEDSDSTPCIKSKIFQNYQVNNDDMENSSDKESEMENESIQSNTVDPADKYVENSMVTNNTNINWHNQSIYAKLCLICKKKLPPKTSTKHYKMHHGENYISRLDPDLLHKFKQYQFRKPIYGVDRTPKLPTWFYRCPFCLEHLNISMAAWLNHFQNHTAEFRYECSQCHKCNNHAYIIRGHIKEHCKGATMVCSDVKQTSSTTIKAHVCHLCNFIQLKRDNLDSHYIVQHQLQQTNLNLLGHTITLFDTKNVEMVEEDIQAWKSLKSEDKIKGIVEDLDEQENQNSITKKKAAEEVENEFNNDLKLTRDKNTEITSPKSNEKSSNEESRLNRTRENENPCSQSKISSQNCYVTINNFNNSQTESETGIESLHSKTFHQKVAKIKPKNTNIHWHSQSKYIKFCMICEKKLPGKCSAFHYNMHHGENYISRLAPEVLEKFNQCKFSRPLFGVEKKTTNRPSWFYRCPFCLKYYNTSIPVWLQHFKDHTAEFLFECSRCHRGNNRKDLILRHIKDQCKEATVVRSDVNRSIHTLIKAHVCHLCNFMQLKRSNLDRHYLEQHIVKKKDIASLGYTLTLFNAKNVEMITEDKTMEKENEILKSLKSKEQGIQDITSQKITTETLKGCHKAASPKDNSVKSIDKQLDRNILNQSICKDDETVQDIQDDLTKEPLLLRFNSSQDYSLEPQLEVVEPLTPTQVPKISIMHNVSAKADGHYKVAGLNLNTIDGIFDGSTASPTLLNTSDNSKDETSLNVVAAENYEDNPNQNPQSFLSNTGTYSSNCKFSNANPNNEIAGIQDETENGKTLGNHEVGETKELNVTSSFFTLDHEFICYHCNFKTHKFYDLEAHYQNVHNSVIETAKTFWFYINLKSQHLPQDVPKFKNDHLMDILKLGESQTSYQCSICADIFPNSVAIVEHACNVHAGEESFSFSQLKNTLIYHCAACCFTSTKEMDLLLHTIDHYFRFQKCNFCTDLQNSFVGYMQHCYAEHREDISRFREIYPLTEITKYLLNMLIVFPNGLILTKNNLLNTEYGKTEVIEKFYEEMCKISQQPPIPRLSIANLVAQHKINCLSSHHVFENEPIMLESLKAKKILKRRYTVAVNQEDNIICERKPQLTNETLQKPKIIKQ